MSDKNTPNIAEKVKFWEEQDKINQALIPRIIEMNERLKELVERTTNIDERIAASESRVIQRYRPLRVSVYIAISLSALAILLSILSYLS